MHCLYRTRDTPSIHGLSRRFQETDEVQKRLNDNEAKKALKRKARADAKDGDDQKANVKKARRFD